MTALPLRVIKLGGSLLDLPDLDANVHAWIARQSPARNLMIVGGGALADAIRAADRLHHLSERAAHWLCVQTLSITAQLIAELLPTARLIRRVEELDERGDAPPVYLLDVLPFLREDEVRSDPPLPASWDVTSDSIAARVARVLRAEELVLLKSALPAMACNAQSLADEGYVDRYFPQAVQGLTTIRYVNLRDAEFAQVSLGPTGRSD